MKKILLAFICAALVIPAVVSAAEEGAKLDKVDIDLGNKDALRRGAKYFVNYCMGCHSLKFESYSRLAKDLGLTKKQVFDNLMFSWSGKQRLGDHMTIAMPPAEAEKWFGKAPPDLTLSSRNRGVDWLYTYLRSFYLDPSRPTGVNNVVFPKVGMPDVLWQLQGFQKAKFKEVDANGTKAEVFESFEPATKGTMTPDQFDQAVRDLVTFLAYVGEPGKQQLHRTGVWVILFLIIFTAIAYALKREYWKDVH
jgi:ubiquinol-cytochrome c reductase cytochrome c1 subunit